jgi:hypothetical protein
VNILGSMQLIFRLSHVFRSFEDAMGWKSKGWRIDYVDGKVYSSEEVKDTMRGLRIKNVSKIYKFMGSHRKGESL